MSLGAAVINTERKRMLLGGPTSFLFAGVKLLGVETVRSYSVFTKLSPSATGLFLLDTSRLSDEELADIANKVSRVGATHSLPRRWFRN